ncbi:MAG TPA: hypothetical protein PLN21_21825 [Gemmatales bacterium]|nr:hypothetical protein [Gemmatales bacterium]
MNDDLDDILKPREAPEASVERQAQLLTGTIVQLKRTRRIRRVQLAALWAAVFLVGVSVGWLGLQREPAQMAKQIVPSSTAPETPPLLTAAQLELQAEKADDPAQSAQLYRQAGDRFLEAQDLRSALRCYRIHLNEGGPGVHTVLASDSWLLMNLKTSNEARR